MGFHAVDDYTYLHWAGSLSLPQYLAQNLDPRVQTINYRPVRRLLYLVEYLAFDSEAALYHLVQLLIHVANVLLVFFLLWNCANRWRLAYSAALIYGGFPIASEAVLWISDEATLAAFFSLVAVLCWLRYLQTKTQKGYFAALLAMTLALLTKETAIAVPLTFLLIDLVFVRERTGALDLARRYSPVAVVIVAYLALQWPIQERSLFTAIGRYSIGLHVLVNYAAYLAMLVFPWGLQHPSSQDIVLWGGAVAIGIVCAALRKFNIVFMFLLTLAAIGPVVMGPFWVVPRYLYLATIPASIIWAAGFDRAYEAFKPHHFRVAISVGIAILVFLNSNSVRENIDDVAQWSRRARVPFGDVVRQHPNLLNDTRLFFIEPPFMKMPDIAGFFFLKYGKKVSVSATFQDGLVYTGGLLPAEKALLRDHATAIVYYFDDTNRPIEVPVDREAKTEATPALPQDFTAPIRLEGYEVTSTRLARGEVFVVILYWRATGGIPKDYTVFVHMVDDNGRMVAGADGMPRNGEERTSEWRTSQFTADAHILPITKDAPLGQNYHLEVGLYELSTMQRVQLADQEGIPSTDRIVIGPLSVID